MGRLTEAQLQVFPRAGRPVTGRSKYEPQHEVRRYLGKDVVPRLGRLRIEEITDAEIVTAIEQIGKRSARWLPISASHWIADRAILAQHPLISSGRSQRLF
jgi:hypothetical protein